MEEGDTSTEMEMNECPLLLTTSDDDDDHNGNTTTRQNYLLRIILFLQSTEIFIAGARAPASRSPSLSRVSSSLTSYSVLSATDAKDGLDLEIVVVDDDDDDGRGPAVSGHNNSSASQTDNIGIELQRQRKSFKRIFREKNLQSLNARLGGVEGVADAFNTDLGTGISGNSEEISQRKMIQVSQNWDLSQNYLHFLKKSCKSWSIGLLSLAGVLSLGFGMKEKGSQSGWVDGAIVFVTIFLLLLFSSIRNWFEARRAKEKPQKDVKVGVVRGGKEVLVSVSDLVYGDLVCLKAGCLIPADGLFVCGEGLEIDDGTLCSVSNEQNPFLFYGSRVVKGSAKMLVISEGLDDTVLGEMMREAMNSSSSTQKKTNIETSIDKLSECINVGGILISILICVVAFLRFMKGKIDDDSGGNRPDSKGAPTELERILHSLKVIFAVSKGNARVLTTLLGVLLVGIMEGIPFVVAIAIARWNSTTLSDRASAKDVLSCVKMAKVTTICTDQNVGWLNHTTQQETRDLVESGIKIILFSQNDDVAEVKMVSRECGICETDAEVLTGDDLQKCTTNEEMFEMLESVKVVGKCNSALKQRIVRCLRSKGEVVAVVGERSYDAPMMKEAAIGLAIKTEFSEITIDSANLVIVKGSFGLLIDMIICGRIINENLQKFIQVEVIMTIASSLINFISALSSGDTPLSPIQLFWIYFLISFPGGLALLSGQPNKNLQDTIRPTGPLITKTMWVNILLQSSYQIAICVTLQLKGTAILGTSKEANESMIFNAFVLCQMFNIFSARELKELNIFKGIGQNSWFWVGSGAFVVIHVSLVAVDQTIASDAGLNWKQWVGCCLIGAGTWLLDLVAKFHTTEMAIRHWTPKLIRICSSTPESIMSNLQNPLMTTGSTPNTVQGNSSG
ncbi:PREDICTED: calcium-transporting ATPase 12, plasma membrane-type-like [Ipomoea nil]|uniref:calcium-transporting ATPase 12, plasma membrane-type-like n=1 Tax=Ipomoea nil TaxID=35883 RepID=UPI000901EBFA|nr:PREDICTED: calcium-transporting ATPase 12, plasma membrane-type-like [Ipomoea nil]